MKVNTIADLRTFLKVTDYIDGPDQAGELLLRLERKVIDNEVDASDDIEDIAGFEKQHIMDAIKHQAKAHKLKRGDVISFKRFYRNKEVLGMYDGKGIVDLCTDLDDYGLVPSEFVAFHPFVPDYWQGIVVHNDYVWLDLTSSVEEILSSVKFTAPVSHAYFTHSNKKCLLEIVDNQAPLDEAGWLEALQTKLRRPQPHGLYCLTVMNGISTVC